MGRWVQGTQFKVRLFSGQEELIKILCVVLQAIPRQYAAMMDRKDFTAEREEIFTKNPPCAANQEEKLLVFWVVNSA